MVIGHLQFVKSLVLQVSINLTLTKCLLCWKSHSRTTTWAVSTGY